MIGMEFIRMNVFYTIQGLLAGSTEVGLDYPATALFDGVCSGISVSEKCQMCTDKRGSYEKTTTLIDLESWF